MSATAPIKQQGAMNAVLGFVQWLERIPYSLLAIPLRIAVATVFWRSGLTKIPNWDNTVFLFTEEYKVPVLAPEVAAYMATALELSCPVLLVLGFFTRGAALSLLGMTAVIQTFVYPEAWPVHIQWAAMLLVLVARGPGVVSIDRLVHRRFFSKG